MKCPRCGGFIEKRENRQTRSIFYGCSNYPDCRVTFADDAYRKLNDLPPQSWEEQQAREAPPDDLSLDDMKGVSDGED